jgi:hypothetical protein
MAPRLVFITPLQGSRTENTANFLTQAGWPGAMLGRPIGAEELHPRVSGRSYVIENGLGASPDLLRLCCML